MKTLIAFLLSVIASHAAEVRIESIPEGGMQPQVALDASGTTHLIYLKGAPKGSNVRYVRRAKGVREWSAPVTVNSESESAVAMGTIRGAQFAFGKGGMLHVVWNGAMRPDGGHGSPLYYTRLDVGATKFAPQRNLLGEASGLDGGASVTADEKGAVYIVWHGQRGGGDGEAARVVFVLKSSDNGGTFAKPVVANAGTEGVCACCSLRALATQDGLFTLYRAARTSAQRDMTLLASRDGGVTFRSQTLHPWKMNMCPMSSAALLATPGGLRGAWETEGKVFTAPLDAPAAVELGKGKHPVLAINAARETLAAWVVGTGWNKGGELAWVILDKTGKPTAQRGTASGIPVWSHAAAYAEPGGNFVILR